MLTYQDLLLPYGLKESKGKKYSKCPLCKDGILTINSDIFFCSKCKFIGNEQALFKKLNISVDHCPKTNFSNDGLLYQVRINNPDRPLFLVFDLQLFEYLANQFPKINLVLNPTVSTKEVQNKILYICSQDTEFANLFYGIAKILKILDCSALLNCKNEDELRQLILKSNFYEPYPICGYIISDDKEIVDYANKLKYTAFLAKVVSPSLIEENSNVFFLYKRASLSDIAKVINPLFKKTQNIFLLDAESITVKTVADIISEKRQFTIQLKKIIYEQYKHLIESSKVFSRIPFEIFENTMKEFYGCEKLINSLDFNSFLNLIISKYDFLIKNIT